MGDGGGRGAQEERRMMLCFGFHWDSSDCRYF